ncbi:MAG: response regulator [Elusimicrobia bacterium]|nr:response regulator [Elusimicrobiota bacterium]
MIARILVVDDNMEVREQLREYLVSKRHEVLEANDGAEAFAVAEEEVPHLIIMDLVMPGVYGSAATKRLQEYWRTSKIPIIIISGTTEAPVKALMDANENIRFMKKPVDLQLLDSTITELLPRGGFAP